MDIKKKEGTCSFGHWLQVVVLVGLLGVSGVQCAQSPRLVEKRDVHNRDESEAANNRPSANSELFDDNGIPNNVVQTRVPPDMTDPEAVRVFLCRGREQMTVNPQHRGPHPVACIAEVVEEGRVSRHYGCFDGRGNPVLIAEDEGADGHLDSYVVREYGEYSELETEQQCQLKEHAVKGCRLTSFKQGQPISIQIDETGDGMPEKITQFEYDEQGRQVAKDIDRNADGHPDWRQVTFFLDDERLKVREYGEVAEPLRHVEREVHDDKGRLIRRERYNLEGELRDRTVVTYDAKGRKSKEEIESRRGKVIQQLTWTYRSDGEQVAQRETLNVRDSSNDAVSYERRNILDDSGRLVASETEFADGKTKVEFHGVENGRRITVLDVYTPQDNTVGRVERHYDADGNLVLEIQARLLPENKRNKQLPFWPARRTPLLSELDDSRFEEIRRTTREFNCLFGD